MASSLMADAWPPRPALTSTTRWRVRAHNCARTTARAQACTQHHPLHNTCAPQRAASHRPIRRAFAYSSARCCLSMLAVKPCRANIQAAGGSSACPTRRLQSSSARGRYTKTRVQRLGQSRRRSLRCHLELMRRRLSKVWSDEVNTAGPQGQLRVQADVAVYDQVVRQACVHLTVPAGTCTRQ